MPANVIVGWPFQRLVREMLTHSPTFRAQCARVADAPHLRLVVRLDMFTRRRDFSARTVFTFGRAGDVVAHVDVQVRTNYAPIVGHEFEHVIEQLDHVRLDELAGDAAAGVHEVEPGVYETERAIRAGNAVEDEMFGGRRITRLGDPATATRTVPGT